MSNASRVAYILFDVESVADGQLISKVRYPGEKLTADTAITRYQAELMERNGSSFIPYTHQLPVSIIVGKVDSSFRLMDLVALDEPHYRSHVMTEHFWRGWDGYGKPTLVSFNGRGFDIPLLELAAFRYGISIPNWFDSSRGYSQPRNRFNTNSHLDLQEVLVNFGATRFNGGLNLAATLLGKPGKMDVQGDMVQELFDEGRMDEINDYCRCDVLDTYFVFLRYLVLAGQLKIDLEQQLVASTKEWLVEQAEERAAYSSYLNHWSDWTSPWSDDSTNSATPSDSGETEDDRTANKLTEKPAQQDAHNAC